MKSWPIKSGDMDQRWVHSVYYIDAAHDDRNRNRTRLAVFSPIMGHLYSPRNGKRPSHRPKMCYDKLI